MGTESVVVLGAGVMGTNIATLVAGHGLSVILIDTDVAKVGTAQAKIAQQTRMAQIMGAFPTGVASGEVRATTSSSDAREAEVVIEAVNEIATVKATALAEVSALAALRAVIITNTSSIPVGQLADAVTRPEALIGTHFMNPAYLIRTVEVIRGPHTTDETLAATRALLSTLGRESVVVRDTPGFVTSRVLHPMINTAAQVVQQGTATPEDVDALMQGCLGHPTGPLRTADLIGLDNLVDSLRVLYDRTGDESCRPCDLLLSLVAAGHHGRKSGRGFYDYEEAMP